MSAYPFVARDDAVASIVLGAEQLDDAVRPYAERAMAWMSQEGPVRIGSDAVFIDARRGDFQPEQRTVDALVKACLDQGLPALARRIEARRAANPAATMLVVMIDTGALVLCCEWKVMTNDGASA